MIETTLQKFAQKAAHSFSQLGRAANKSIGANKRFWNNKRETANG